jgi:CHRD domain
MIAVRRLLAVLALAVVVAVVAAAPAGAQTASTKCTLFAVLKPGNEVRPPDTTDPVDSRATGASLVHINGTRITFTTVIGNPARETFTLGHIHRGAADVNGPVVVDFFNGMSTRRLFTQFDTGTLRPPFENPAEICADPAGFYVNYHTAEDPMGAVRGQLKRLF